jgi:hypothetical protein
MAQVDEIVVRLRSEGGESVEEAFRRVGSSADKVAGSTDRVGRSLDGLRLKSDERLSRNIGAIAQEFARGGSAADVMAVSVTRLGESFRGSLLLGATAFIGLGLYEAIVRTGEAMIKLNAEVAGLTSRAKVGGDFLGTGQLDKNLTDITAKIREVYALQVERNHSLRSSLLGTGGAGPLAGIIPALNAGDQKKIDDLTKASAATIDEITKKTETLNKIENLRLDGNEYQAALQKEQIDNMERLGALADAAAAAGIAGTETAERSLAAENARYNLRVKSLQLDRAIQKEALDKEQTTFQQRVGSGQFVQDLEKQRIADLQSQRGQDVIQELRQAQERGVALGPNAQGILKEADRIDKAKTDFSGIASLSGLKFEGLRALDSITVR